jgi:CubicO group peptidase (beta-lactamase class C family)
MGRRAAERKRRSGPDAPDPGSEWSMGRIALTLLAVALAGPAEGQAGPLRGFDAYVERAMAEWKVPGLAVAVVRHDSVVHARGYGVRTLGRSGPVGPRTLFAIGSSTKAFTGLAVAMLVDKGRVRWDDPVTRYLPGFQLYDPYVTRELTVRDLLTHRSGLSSSDVIAYAEGVTRDTILQRMRYVRPSWSFRSRYGYQNIMYLAAGQLTARLEGMTWDEVMRRRILLPLGMSASNTSITALDGQPDVATPHAEVDDTIRPVPYFNLDVIAPAGSINSNVTDMAQWVRFQLAGGAVGGQRLLREASFAETHAPQTIVPLEGFWKTVAQEAHLLNYGIGWYLHDYRGRKVVQHGGNIDGMSALVALLPEERTGMVVLTNLDGNDLTYALMYRVFDAYLRHPPKDWSAAMLKADRELRAKGEKEKASRESQRVAGTRPALPVERYAGIYADSFAGDATVRREASGLVFQYGRLVADLVHWHYDTFQAVWRQRRLGESYVTFTLDDAGKVDEMKVEGLVDFERKAETDTVPGVSRSGGGR